MKFPYDQAYDPPFPAVRAALENVDEGLKTKEIVALLDTGSDGSLVPTAYRQEILAPAILDTHLRSHWGEWRTVQLFVVDLVLNGLRLPGVMVVGDEQGSEIILGRDVLNKLRTMLDGPANQTDISG